MCRYVSVSVLVLKRLIPDPNAMGFLRGRRVQARSLPQRQRQHLNPRPLLYNGPTTDGCHRRRECETGRLPLREEGLEGLQRRGMWNSIHGAKPDQAKCWKAKTHWKRAGQMERFRQCWKAQGNDKRTGMKDADK